MNSQTKTRHLRIRRTATSYRPGVPAPQDPHAQLARKTLNLHLAIPTEGVEATDDENAAVGVLRDQLRGLHFVSDCCRCQDKGQVGVKFQVSEAAEGYDQLLSSVFLQLRDILEASELLRRQGASWRANYETGSLADEGLFTALAASRNGNN